MEKMIRRANYTGSKFLIQHIKKDIKNLFKPDGVFRRYDISGARIDKVKKIYYDTPDKFFRRNGLNISLNQYSTKGYYDIIVRYDSEIERIEFISNLPDTFIKKITKSDRIDKHYDYMATAILELIPKGLNADVFEVIRQIRPILEVSKKRTRFRVISNDGLKMVFSFEQSVYASQTHKNQRVKLPTLEIRLESPAKTKPLYDKLLRQIQLQEAMFIRLKHSDLFIGEEYLDL